MSEQETNQAVTKQVQNRGKRRLLLAGIPTVVVLGSAAIYMMGGRYAETDNAYVQSDITSITNLVSGPIVSINVKENDAVSKGQLLYTIDPEPYQIAVSRAEANLESIRSNLLAQKATYKEKLIELQLAETKLAYYQREEKRQKDLLQKDFISNSDFDAAQESRREAELNVASLKESLNTLKEMLGGNPTAPVETHSAYKSLQAALDKAKLDLSYTQILAPADGIVSKLPNAGEYTTTGATSLVLVADNEKRIEANFTEKDLAYVKTGQSVEIKVDTYPDYEWKGTVESISPATGSEFSVIPAENATGNWVKIAQRLTVRIAIEADQNAPVLRSGMSTEVSIDTKHQRSLFGFTL